MLSNKKKIELMVNISHKMGGAPAGVTCVVFLGKTLYSHSASLHPGV